MAKMDVDKDVIHKLALLLEENGLTEIELEEDGRRVRVARSATAGINAVVPAALPEAVVQTEIADAPIDHAEHPGAVLSPMVGTVFVAPEPGADAFVTVGDTVAAGQSLLIIEAMKTMNQIPAPRDGKIVEILVADGQPVEYGDPLMIIE